MGAEYVQVRVGAYADSVTLMQVSASAQAVSGVRAAMIAMATELNLALLAELSLTAPAGVSPNDLLVAIKADDAGSLDAALEVVDAALTGRSPTQGQVTAAALVPRTTSSAIARSGTGIVLVSVPGQHAFAEAMDALSRDCTGEPGDGGDRRAAEDTQEPRQRAPPWHPHDVADHVR